MNRTRIDRYICVVALMISLFSVSSADSSQNPFESKNIDRYTGKWGNAKDKASLLLYPSRDGGMQGVVTRDKVSLKVQASFSQGMLHGRMIQGTRSYPIKITNNDDKISLESGTWKTTLSRYKEISFEGRYEKDAFEMELQKASDGTYIGGIKMDGAVYVIQGQAKRSLLWGQFSKDGESWPFFIHWTGSEFVSFHTGQFVQNKIVSLKQREKRIAAGKKAAREKHQELYEKAKAARETFITAKAKFDGSIKDLKNLISSIPQKELILKDTREEFLKTNNIFQFKYDSSKESEIKLYAYYHTDRERRKNYTIENKYSFYDAEFDVKIDINDMKIKKYDVIVKSKTKTVQIHFRNDIVNRQAKKDGKITSKKRINSFPFLFNGMNCYQLKSDLEKRFNNIKTAYSEYKTKKSQRDRAVDRYHIEYGKYPQFK